VGVEEFRLARAKSNRGQTHRLAHQNKAPQKILFSLEKKEIRRAQNEKSKEYFSVVYA